MSFRTKPNAYAISLAPTGRARCRKCRRHVAAGAVRLVTTAFIRPGRATCFVRCGTGTCIDLACAHAILSVYGAAARVPVDPRVSPAEAERVRACIESYRGR